MLLVLASCVQMSAQYDTIWGRNPNYYYSEWYDTCPGYFHPWTYRVPTVWILFMVQD